MKVLEKFIAAKTGNLDDCEDMIFESPDFVAVIDGVTSRKGELVHNVSVGRKAAELIRKEFEYIPREADAKTVVLRLDSSIRNFYSENGRLEEAKGRQDARCSVGVIIYSDFRRQIWRVGDCGALIDLQPWTGRKFLDNLLSELRACYLESEIRRGRTIEELLAYDTARAYLQELLSRQVYFQNAEEPSVYNYAVLDGFFQDMPDVEMIDLPPDAKSVVLGSDGYPVLRPSLAESEAEVARILRADPLCFRIFKTTKGVYRGNSSFDDRSYVRIDVSDNSVRGPERSGIENIKSKNGGRV